MRRRENGPGLRAYAVGAALVAIVAIALPFSTSGLANVTLASAPVHRAPAVAAAVVAATDAVVPAPAGAETPAEPAGIESPAEAPAPDACAEALDWVAGAGLVLPAGVGYHCPSAEFAHQGAACWYSATCPDAAYISINMDRMPSATTAYLHHVVAHEVCHILDWQSTGWTTEAGADACAAAHGAPA